MDDLAYDRHPVDESLRWQRTTWGDVKQRLLFPSLDRYLCVIQPARADAHGNPIRLARLGLTDGIDTHPHPR
ncbi:MAG TPA: hypothetical protein VMF09_15015 [Solirubrobacteraceae bacterium]|nr:hypothetical protein [Solirubrobacteraceae bacterium]